MNDSNDIKLKVLFIAQNIPVPGIRPSRIIIDIAHQISSFAEVIFLYPSELIPFGFHFLSKYKPFYKLKNWNFEGFNITVKKYFRAPYSNAAFWFWNKLSKHDIKYYKEYGPFDIIHAHYLFPDGFLAYLYSKKFNVPYIITIRNADIRHLKKIGKNNPDFKKASFIINNASEVLSLNLAYKIFIDELFNVSSIIVPHGIEESAYYKNSDPPANKIIITIVSEFIKRKNIDWVIEAFKSYKGNKKIELNVIGSGPLNENLKSIAGNDDRIHFLGKIDRPAVLNQLQKSDIFALPSFDESFGLVYIEAAASKNAIIGLKDEGVWGVFEKNSELLFSIDRKHFEKTLHFLIDDSQLILKLKEGAYKKAKMLNWKDIAKRYKSIYNQSISMFDSKH